MLQTSKQIHNTTTLIYYKLLITCLAFCYWYCNFVCPRLYLVSFMTCLARNELLIFWYFLLLKLLVCLTKTYNYKIKIHISPNCIFYFHLYVLYSVAKMNYILTTYGFVQIKQHLIKIELQFAKVCLTHQIWYTVQATL